MEYITKKNKNREINRRGERGKGWERGEGWGVNDRDRGRERK